MEDLIIKAFHFLCEILKIGLICGATLFFFFLILRFLGIA